MNDWTDSPLLDELRRDRDAQTPEDAQARVGSRLGLGGPLLPAVIGGGARAASGAAMYGRSVLAAAFLGGAAIGAFLHAVVAAAPATRVVYVDRPPVQATSAAIASSAEAPTASPPPAAVDSVLPSARIAVTTGSLPPTGPAQLDAERALLDLARGALVRGESEEALRLLDRHVRTYRRALLGEERDALFVQALVSAGRGDEARARAEAFRRATPQSLLLPAVDAAIASIH